MNSSNLAKAARKQAREILSKPPFNTHVTHSTPRPFAGVLHFLGKWIDRIFGPVLRFLRTNLLSPIGSGFGNIFGHWWPFALGVLLLVLGFGLSWVLIHRRQRLISRLAAPDLLGSSVEEDPLELEQAADEAESKGYLADAIRLRFRAGLLRLEKEGVIANRSIRTARELVARLSSPTFNLLATRYEEIVYAKMSADSSDVIQARIGWPKVFKEVKSANHDLASN